MKKWKTVRIRQELVEEIKKEIEKKQYQSLSDFVSEAIRLRMQSLAKERVSEYLERDRRSRVPHLKAKRLYTPRHVWAQKTSQGNIRVGITDYFQKKAKEIAYIMTNKFGDEVSKDEPFGVAETWWFVYDLYPPMNGKIVSVNQAVIDDPLILNTDTNQWIIEIEPAHKISSWKNELLSSEEYEKLVAELDQPKYKMTTDARATYFRT